ncbi:hypothetical protein [Falsirhodobacter sp. alg1]|uniref:hypothetical protein n=1 Tax=Falsirhodobacter sp. alg1 TaxID=1472418 RepID=UPI0005EE3CF9|nr:hypothetical protein [Falsirhodobacter sp. alg1]
MSFTAEWLALREPVDTAARNADVLAAFVADVGPDTSILDLGSGTGSTLRAVSSYLAQDVQWTLTDMDATLLQHAGHRHPDANLLPCDLNDLASLPLIPGGHVTASALFDLCSADYVQRLIARLDQVGASLYAALNYDGRMEWSVFHPLDAAVTAAFNLHQQRDKGFGPALGPRSAEVLSQSVPGYRVVSGPSDWVLTADHEALQTEYLRGIGIAVAETGLVPDIDKWVQARIAMIPEAECRVGHMDVLILAE